jgi:pyruvate/2-oxoglutarate dehydrogenase complex dihydrolipoamide acyltransferase (E2) component/uncharacterized OsmC-like protein
MPFVIQMPKLGHTMTEGTVLEWHKREGDTVREGEPVLTVETDKARVAVEAPVAGVLHRCVAAEGAVIAVGGALAIIAQNGEVVPNDVSAAAHSAPPIAGGAQRTARAAASPRARRLAAERGIDVARIAGTGPGGLVTEDDVRRAAAAAQQSQSAGAAPGSVAGADAADAIPAHREKLTRIQLAGARNLTAAWKEVPHFVQMVRVDMSRAMRGRDALRAGGARTGVNDVILAAAVAALRDNPRVNASYRDGELLVYERIDLGIAVDTPDGLVVPVIHDAGALDIAALAGRCAELATRARERRLHPADLETPTFTVSNLGAYGVENGTPVIFAPQAALMFAGAIHDEVLAVAGKPEVRPAMQLAIAYDHRALDGAAASRFTTRVKQLLEDVPFLPAAPGESAAASARRREVSVTAEAGSLRAEVEYGGFRWTLDGDHRAGPDPVSSFLGALGGCLLMSLRVAAQVRKAEVGRASVHASANEKGHVKEIEVKLQVETPLDDAALQKLVEVAERGCHVRALIRDDVKVALTVTRI